MSKEQEANNQEKFPVHKTLTEHLPAPQVEEITVGPIVTTFIGHAALSVKNSDAFWKILRMTVDSTAPGTITTIIEYADGDMKYDNVWDDRATLKYSR